MNRFAVNKQQSIAIINSINAALNEVDNPVCLYHKSDEADTIDDTKKIITMRHKLKFAEISTDFNMGDNNSDHYNDIIVNDETINYAIDIEIYECEYKDSSINLTAYMVNSQAECDVSYPSFEYDDVVQCWIIKNDFWGCPDGIDDNGIISVLDFSEYM